MKGQTFIPDYVASLLIFGIILSIFLSSWNSVLSSQRSPVLEENMMSQAAHTTTFLVSTPGYPDNWEKNGVKVQIPGFAEPDHVLQGSKFEEFRSIGYERQKRLLQAPEYYMSVENDTHILELNGNKLEFGKDYSGADTVVPVTRNVQVNISGDMKTARLKYVVWKDDS